MVVDVVEEVETNPANGLLFHHRLVENPAQDVGYDGRRVLNSLSKIKGFHKVYIIKVAQKQKKKLIYWIKSSKDGFKIVEV